MQLLSMEKDVLRERYAERWALGACRSATFSGCLKAFGVAPAITVSNARGKTLSVRASDVYAARTRFPAGPEPDQEDFALTSVGDRLVELFLGWLLHEHSDRYRSIAAEDQLAWLRQVAQGC